MAALVERFPALDNAAPYIQDIDRWRDQPAPGCRRRRRPA
jgi:hypothetical protein